MFNPIHSSASIIYRCQGAKAPHVKQQASKVTSVMVQITFGPSNAITFGYFQTGSLVCQQEHFRQLLMCCREFWDTSALSPSEQNMKMVQSWIILTLEAVHVMTICTASRETSATSDSLWLFSLLGSRKERKRLPSGLSPTYPQLTRSLCSVTMQRPVSFRYICVHVSALSVYICVNECAR